MLTNSATGAVALGGERRGRALYVCVCAGTATGRKGSMWAAVPAAGACEAAAAAAADEDDVPLGPGQLPPRNAELAPLHAEINISIIMIKGQLELEVICARCFLEIEVEFQNSRVCSLVSGVARSASVRRERRSAGFVCEVLPARRR